MQSRDRLVLGENSGQKSRKGTKERRQGRKKANVIAYIVSRTEYHDRGGAEDVRIGERMKRRKDAKPVSRTEGICLSGWTWNGICVTDFQSRQ